MSETVSIAISFGRKAKIDVHAFHAIKRGIRIFEDDRRVAAYAAAPHEGITPEIVSAIRRRMIINGELPARAFSRRREIAHG